MKGKTIFWRSIKMTQSNSDNRKKTVVIVALLLALVLVLGIGGYTLAKYITSGNGEGTANVAKWGYTVSVDTSKLFGKNYKSKVVTDDTTAANLSVASSSDANVVAPGTSGSLTLNVNGTAEVASKLNVQVADVQDISLTYGSTTYSPVKWTLNDGTTDVVKDGTLASVAEELNKIKDVEVNAGDSVNKSYTLSWVWAFDGGNDEADTALGLLAAEKAPTHVGEDAITASNLTVKFTLSVSIEQIER